MNSKTNLSLVAMAVFYCSRTDIGHGGRTWKCMASCSSDEKI